MGTLTDILNFIGQREQANLDKEQWKVKKQQLDMAIEERDKHLEFYNSLPPEQQKLFMVNKELLGKTLFYDDLIKKLAGGGQQEPRPQTFEQTGEAFRPREDMLPKQGLVDQMTTGQLGMNPQDILKDIIKKETGIGESVEPVKTESMMNEKGQWEVSQVLRNGKIRRTGQIVPQKIIWKDAMGPQGVYQEAMDEYGKKMPEFDRFNIPQDTQTIQGTMPGTNLPATLLTPKQVPPGFQGLAIPGAVKGESITMTGPRGEQSTMFVNPYAQTGGGGKALPGTLPGIPTKPAQPTTVGVAQQTEMMKSGLEALKKIKNSIFDLNTGAINRKNLANAKLGMPRSEGKRIGDLIGSALNAIRLASTGAAFSPKELIELKAQYIPDYLANDQQVYDQWDQLTRFVGGMLQQMDPNEVFTKNQQEEFNKLISIPKSEIQSAKGLIHLEVGQDEYFIPPDKIDAFMKEFPKARRLSK